MSHTALIKIAPVFSTERVLDPALTVPGRTLYQRGGLTLEGEAPVLVDHDQSRPIGIVRELVEVPDVDGHWIAAYASITDPPAWLERGTRASFAVGTIQRQQIGDTERVLRGLVFEVSVLTPGTEPDEPLAQVLTVRRTETTQPGGQVIVHTMPTLLVRHNIGQVLGVR